VEVERNQKRRGPQEFVVDSLRVAGKWK